MSATSSFDASFRCGARLPVMNTTNPFVLRVGNIAPAYLIADASMTGYFTEFGIGPISTQTQPYTFNAPSTPVSCAVRIGDGYSTNSYCRLDTCVGDDCNMPKAFSVVHSADSVCSRNKEDVYNIGCNPDAPESVRTECVEWFQDSVEKGGKNIPDSTEFEVNFAFNGTTSTKVQCRKYGAGKMPGGHNLYDNISCEATLKNGEVYTIYAADTGGSPINSLQTTAKTAQFDDEEPTMELKYYTDNSLQTETVTTKWSNTPIVAVAICNDTPRGESTACSCAQRVVGTTDPLEDWWSEGVFHGTVDIGADLLRYTRIFADNFTGTELV